MLLKLLDPATHCFVAGCLGRCLGHLQSLHVVVQVFDSLGESLVLDGHLLLLSEVVELHLRELDVHLRLLLLQLSVFVRELFVEVTPGSNLLLEEVGLHARQATDVDIAHVVVAPRLEALLQLFESRVLVLCHLLLEHLHLGDPRHPLRKRRARASEDAVKGGRHLDNVESLRQGLGSRLQRLLLLLSGLLLVEGTLDDSVDAAHALHLGDELLELALEHLLALAKKLVLLAHRAELHLHLRHLLPLLLLVLLHAVEGSGHSSVGGVLLQHRESLASGRVADILISGFRRCEKVVTVLLVHLQLLLALLPCVGDKEGLLDLFVEGNELRTKVDQLLVLHLCLGILGEVVQLVNVQQHLLDAQLLQLVSQTLEVGETDTAAVDGLLAVHERVKESESVGAECHTATLCLEEADDLRETGRVILVLGVGESREYVVVVEDSHHTEELESVLLRLLHLCLEAECELLQCSAGELLAAEEVLDSLLVVQAHLHALHCLELHPSLLLLLIYRSRRRHQPA
mmetsp:Transcript_21461/g.83234  ORF Transcript_21461/g.83234 Transcript_21461/m.83234 type:complete len:515 (+) Transcript_21461:1260-2804(+)